MKALLEFLFGKRCEHEWKDIDTLTHHRRRMLGPDAGAEVMCAMTYVQKCSKCNAIRSYRVP